MKKNVILLFLITNTFLVNAQNNAVSGILDFLSANPGTSKHLTDGQIVGARIISNFLNNQTQQAHEVNVARAGQTQVNVAYPNHQVISAPAEPEARLQREADGRVYLYYGNHEPRLIPEEYLLRSMGIDYETDYTADEMAQLRGKVQFQGYQAPFTEVERTLKAGNGAKRKKDRAPIQYDFTSAEWGENLFGVRDNQTMQVYYLKVDPSYPGKNVKLTWDRTLTFYYMKKPKALWYSFSCNWVEQFDLEDRARRSLESVFKETPYLPLEGYHGIKRKFKHGEKFSIVTLCAIDGKIPFKEVYYHLETGEEFWSNRFTAGDHYMLKATMDATVFPPGKYLYVIEMEDKEGATGEVIIKHQFEILPGDQPAVSEAQQVSNFIQAAPRGIIFFEDYGKGAFVGLNNSGYDINSEDVYIRLNIELNDNNKNVIWQSYNLSGKLLGETVRTVDVPFWTGPESNPTENFDFIDMVKNTGPGKYKIKAIVEATGEEFTRILTIK